MLGSSGNVGEQIGPPGTAKNALCVSATQQDPNEGNFGDGNNAPTPDGRRKPEIMAPGCGIISAESGTGCTVRLDQLIYGTGPICATSWATPAAAGAAALVRQYFTEGYYPSGTQQPHHAFTPSEALLKATLLNSTMDMAGIAGYPGNQEGWGLIRLDNVLFFTGSPRNLCVWDTRNADGLFTGESRDHHVDVVTNGQPLRVTLVWTEPPAASNSANPSVNNLDLQVISPDGTQVFRGNVFGGGVSTTGGVVQVDLRRSPVLKMEVDGGRCSGNDLELLFEEMKKKGQQINPEMLRKRCGRITANGCIEPPVEGQEIILKYTDPLSNVTYHTVKTDENGCFEDFLVNATGGTWAVSAEFPGSDCHGPIVEGPYTVCQCNG